MQSGKIINCDRKNQINSFPDVSRLSGILRQQIEEILMLVYLCSVCVMFLNQTSMLHLQGQEYKRNRVHVLRKVCSL